MILNSGRLGARYLRSIGAFTVMVLALSACASGGSGLGDLFGGGDEPVAPPPKAEGADDITGRTTSNSTIPVIVDDNPITRYDIDQRARILRISGAGGGTKAATEELIDDMIKMVEAQRQGVRIPGARVEGAYGTIAERLGMSTSQFDGALKSEGIQPDSLKRMLRAQVTWSELVRRRSALEAQMTSADLSSALQERGGPDSLTMAEYVLQQIIFVVPAGSPSGTYTQRKREANNFRQRYTGCDTVLEQTRSLKSVVVKNIGRRSEDQLAPQQAEDLAKISEGSTTEPFQSELGIEVIAVCSVRQIKSAASARADIQNKYALEQAEGLGEDYLKELRDRSVIVYR